MPPEQEPQVYRSSLARWASYVWFVVAALNLADIVARGSGQSGRVAFTVVVAVTVLVYLVAFRPAVVLGTRAVVLRNVLRDVTVPWPAVTRVDATDALRVHAGDRVYRSWAVQSPDRGRRRRREKPVTAGRDGVPEGVRAAVAERTHADHVADQAQRARARFQPGKPSADATRPPDGSRGDPYRRWNVAGTVALAVSVALVLVAAALP